MFGMKIIVVPDAQLPKEHYGSSLYIAVAHPFWFWLYRKLNWPTSSLYEVIRGYSRPLYRASATSYKIGDTLYCSRRVYDELKRAIPERPNPLSGYNNLFYPSGRF